MSKKIEFDQKAKEKLKAGIDKVNKAVSITMGPFGRNVLIEKKYGEVSSTKDGVTVAKEITLEDPIENMGATVIKQASQKTVDVAGDGTTTATVLAHSIATQAMDLNKSSKVNVTKVKNGIEKSVDIVLKQLKEMSIDISDEKQIKQIASLSANGDETIGELVFSALDKVGRDGVVTVEESKSEETFLEVVEGLQFNKGYKSHYFVTNNDLMSCILEEPYILIYDKRISVIKDLLPLLEWISAEQKSLLIIAEDIEGEALATFIMNKSRGALKVCAVKAPGFGDLRNQMLEDMAVLTGATVVSQDKGMSFTRFNKDWLGRARLATINKETTTIVDGKGDTEKIDERIKTIKTQLDKEKTPYNVEKLQERLGKMIGGVAIINVGGWTEIEMKEKKDRLEDALQATKSALDEGILPGAGIALFHARESIKKSFGEIDLDKGRKIVYKACEKPLRQILENAGENANNWIKKIESEKNVNFVPKIEDNYLFDCYEIGIIDPTKVVRTALQNASAAAITLLMTECSIVDNPNDNKANQIPDLENYG